MASLSPVITHYSSILIRDYHYYDGIVEAGPIIKREGNKRPSVCCHKGRGIQGGCVFAGSSLLHYGDLHLGQIVPIFFLFILTKQRTRG